MDSVTLTLKPYHLAHLREAVRARALIVNTDTTSTVTDKTICNDLENRVNLLARAVATEHAAREARKQYNFCIHSTPEPNGRRMRKEARKLAEGQPQEQEKGIATAAEKPQEQAQEPPQTKQETASTSSADVVKRTI